MLIDAGLDEWEGPSDPEDSEGVQEQEDPEELVGYGPPPQWSWATESESDQ